MTGRDLRPRFGVIRQFYIERSGQANARQIFCFCMRMDMVAVGGIGTTTFLLSWGKRLRTYILWIYQVLEHQMVKNLLRVHKILVIRENL